VIIKPSEYAPKTSAFISDLIASVFDPEHATVITGGAGTGEALLDLPFEFFCYTGGENVGRLYAEAGARHLSPVLLELGGKCPALIDRNVNLARAAERIIGGKFFNAGQTCIAPDFVVLPSELHDDFLQLCEKEIRLLYGTTSGRDLAKIVNKEHYQRLQKLTGPDTVSIGLDHPGELSLAPRLLPNTQWDSPVMQEEIFGPLLPLLPCENLNQALGPLKSMPSPLALYIFSNDRGESERIASSLPSGSVCFNDVMKTGTNHLLPMGGLGKSGLGRYRGRSGFEQFSHERSFTRRWLIKDPFMVKPPYGNKLTRLRKFLKP
jgi:aldehyde dehydrogenase (NAD+)